MRRYPCHVCGELEQCADCGTCSVHCRCHWDRWDVAELAEYGEKGEYGAGA